MRVLWNIGFYHLQFIAAGMVFFLFMNVWIDVYSIVWPKITGSDGVELVVIPAAILFCLFFYVRYAKRMVKPIGAGLIIKSYLLLAIILTATFFTVTDLNSTSYPRNFTLYSYENWSDQIMIMNLCAGWAFP